MMETKLEALANEYEFDEPQIAHALRSGSEKAKQYVGKALISDYPLLAAGIYYIATTFGNTDISISSTSSRCTLGFL
jgi:hypothetical protein